MKSLYAFVIAFVLVGLSASPAAAQGTCAMSIRPAIAVQAEVLLKADGSPVTVIGGNNSGQLQVSVSPQGNVRACVGLAWTVTASAPFTVQGKAALSLRGSGTLQVAASANAGPARSGTLTFSVTGTPQPGVTVVVHNAIVTGQQAGQ